MAEGIKTPPKFDGLNFPMWKVKMTVFLQSLESRVAKVVTKPFSAPLVMKTLGPILPRRSLTLMLGHTMPCFKLLMTMIFLESFIANPLMRFGLTYLSLMRGPHK